MHIQINPCDWGEALPENIQALLENTASHIHAEMRQPVEGTINVLNLPSEKDPITFYRRTGKGPYEINLTVRDRRWSQYAYQFAHEYCHVQSGYEQLRDNPNNWFHESICELASLYTLRRMGERWRKNPPYPDWATYGPNLTAYADKIISAHSLAGVPDSTFAGWLMWEEPELRKDPCQREKNKVVACRLLGIFEECPGGWNSIRALPASTAPILDYLKDWRAACQRDDRPFVDRVIVAITGGMDDETLEDVQYLIRSHEAAAKHRGASSLRHAPSAYQGEQEVDACVDLGHSLFAQGQGDLREIRKNDRRNFPDCLAELDGNLVGVEVCELIDPKMAGTDWPIDRFSRVLGEAIQNKDTKATKNDRPAFLAALSQLILLVHTDEDALKREVLRQYTERIRFPKPKYIDKAYVLGPYEAINRSVAAAAGREQAGTNEGPRYTAFAVRWGDAGSKQ